MNKDILNKLTKRLSQGKQVANALNPLTPVSGVVDKLGMVNKLMDKLGQKYKEMGTKTYEKKEEPEDNKMEGIRSGILWAENRGLIQNSGDLYKSVGEQTRDLGKYQVSPQTLKTWAKPWLGKDYTEEEFLDDPEAQEEFFNQFLQVANRLKLTPEETAVTWHRGWGNLATGKGTKKEQEKAFRDWLKETMNEDKSKEYLQMFREAEKNRDIINSYLKNNKKQ